MQKITSPSASTPYVRLFALIFSIGVTLGSGLGYGLSQALDTVCQQQQQTQLESRHLGQAEYVRLALGMSLSEVESILDRGTEISRSATTAIFIWKNSDGSQIKATFENGKLKSKEQNNLK
jgi:hypothetical protein